MLSSLPCFYAFCWSAIPTSSYIFNVLLFLSNYVVTHCYQDSVVTHSCSLELQFEFRRITTPQIPYKDSDYTIMIALVHKHILSVLKLTLVLEFWVLLPACQLPLLERSLQLSSVVATAIRKGPRRFWLYFAKITIVHRHLGAKPHPGSEVVSTVIISLLAAFAHSTWAA